MRQSTFNHFHNSRGFILRNDLQLISIWSSLRHLLACHRPLVHQRQPAAQPQLVCPRLSEPRRRQQAIERRQQLVAGQELALRPTLERVAQPLQASCHLPLAYRQPFHQPSEPLLSSPIPQQFCRRLALARQFAAQQVRPRQLLQAMLLQQVWAPPLAPP